MDTYVKAWENQHVLLGQVHACLFHFDWGGGGCKSGGGVELNSEVRLVERLFLCLYFWMGWGGGGGGGGGGGL